MQVEDERGVDALVLEYCEGGDLIRRMVRREQGEPQDETNAFYIWRQIVEGVRHMHSCGVAHLDLKPQNVLIMSESGPGRAKLCDFSHSYVITAQAPKVPASQVGAGKYMAPEVASGQAYEGAPADTWSCGVILYTLLTGALPFADTTKIQQARPAPPLSTRHPHAALRAALFTHCPPHSPHAQPPPSTRPSGGAWRGSRPR